MTQGRRPHPGRDGSRPRAGQRHPGRSGATRGGRPSPPRRSPRRSPRRPPRRSLRGASMLRLRVALIVIAMVISVFAVRLFQLQGIDAKTYAAKAVANQATGLVNEVLPAKRGTITDRNGVHLAESVDGLMIVADPTLTSDHASAIAKILANRLHVDYFDVLERLQKPDTHFQYIARRVPSTQARQVVAAIDAKGYAGIDTRRDPLRTYPAGDIAANLVGFMNGEGQAGEGAELMFDKMLTGKDGSATYEEGGGNRIPLGDNNVVPPRSGHTLRLTIDRDVQWYTQRALRAAVQGASADSGAAVVMDSRTGELLALADYPTYNANDPGNAPQSDLGSRALRSIYEPGSVEKVLTTAALLNEHKVTPRTRIVVPPQITSNDRTIHDDYAHGTLHLTLTGVLAKSSNIGTVLADRQFKPQQLYDYLRRFGLGSTTHLGVNGESAGVLPSWKTWSQINQDNIAFGQGVAVNAVQMAAAVNTIATGGVYVSPSLVKGQATTSQGEVVGSATSTRHRVVSKHAAAQETRMMEAVTGPEGTAPMAAINGYQVAGKTGTAQRVGATCHCYDGTHTVSFAGFAPADQPRFLVYVVVQNPRNGGFGGSTAGPVFREVMSYLLQKYGVPPTGARAPKTPLEW
ncbi:MAG: peptidoglycan D,D-transpeptidase FtsI family protein [Nocardioidaceae bacterium]